MRVGLFVDVSNLYYCVKKKFDGKIDYKKYFETAINGNELYRSYAYGAQIGNEATDFMRRLSELGFELRYKEPRQYENPEYAIDLSPIEVIINQTENNAEAINTLSVIKGLLSKKKDIRKADWDVGLSIDVVKSITRLDTVIIGSADGDLAPLVEWIRDQGCKCIIYACNISSDLKNVADQWFEVTKDVLEFR